MPVIHIGSDQIRTDLHFSAHVDGLYLYTPDNTYRLSVAAGEDLMVNLDVNLKVYQGMVER